ncbi:MAG: hypothetical protein IPO92_08855 [Saprospiraceae bacterium]|nr:hypothetical protein [Saprospiraceae bacterium]
MSQQSLKRSSYKMNLASTGSNIEIEKLQLDGNSVFKMRHGFLTLSGNYENAPSIIRIYSNEGKSIFTQSFTQTINFMMTTAKNFCAFHDMNQIYLIDLVTHKVTTFDGSNVFAVNDAGEVAYYDEKHQPSCIKIQC